MCGRGCSDLWVRSVLFRLGEKRVDLVIAGGRAAGGGRGGDRPALPESRPRDAPMSGDGGDVGARVLIAVRACMCGAALLDGAIAVVDRDDGIGGGHLDGDALLAVSE